LPISPFLRIPGAVGTLPGNTFYSAARADILVSKGDELALGPHLDMEEAAASPGARLGASRAALLGFRHGNLR
jgi:hypothetical protein